MGRKSLVELTPPRPGQLGSGQVVRGEDLIRLKTPQSSKSRLRGVCLLPKGRVHQTVYDLTNTTFLW